MNGYPSPSSLRTTAVRLSSLVLRLRLASIFGTDPSRVRDGADWKKKGVGMEVETALDQFSVGREPKEGRILGTNRAKPGPGQDPDHMVTFRS